MDICVLLIYLLNCSSRHQPVLSRLANWEGISKVFCFIYVLSNFFYYSIFFITNKFNYVFASVVSHGQFGILTITRLVLLLNMR